MTVGVPTIVSNRGALPEVAGDAAQIVDHEDADGLAAGMRRYLDDPAAAAGATARGLARARLFSWNASAATLIDLYRRLTTHDQRGERANASKRAAGAGGAKPPGQ